MFDNFAAEKKKIIDLSVKKTQVIKMELPLCFLSRSPTLHTRIRFLYHFVSRWFYSVSSHITKLSLGYIYVKRWEKKNFF